MVTSFVDCVGGNGIMIGPDTDAIIDDDDDMSVNDFTESVDIQTGGEDVELELSAMLWIAVVTETKTSELVRARYKAGVEIDRGSVDTVGLGTYGVGVGTDGVGVDTESKGRELVNVVTPDFELINVLTLELLSTADVDILSSCVAVVLTADVV